jgi:hypothetical protein
VRDYKPFFNYDGSFYRRIKEEIEAIIPPNKRANHWKIFLKAFIIFVCYIASMYWYVSSTTLFSAIVFGWWAGQL